jgi:Histidine kinase-like ATPase domain
VTGAYPVLHLGSSGAADVPRPAGPAGAPGSRGFRSPRGRWSRTFRGVPASVPEARRFVAGLLAGCPARDVLMTCVSELAANAIEHTDSGHGGVFVVEVDCPRDGVARVAVTDEGSSSVPAPGSLDPMAECGRGLAMVAASTTRWGYADPHPARTVSPDPHPARTVWAESCWPVPVPALDLPPRQKPGPRHSYPTRLVPPPASPPDSTA